MSESPECIKNIKSRLRSLFRLTPSQKNKNCRDEEGSSIDPTVAPDCKVDIDWDPAAEGKHRKQFGKKMFKLRESLFSPKPKDSVKGKKVSRLNHPFVPVNWSSANQNTRGPLPGFAEQRQTDANNHFNDTSARKMTRNRFAAASINPCTVANENHEKTPLAMHSKNKVQNFSECINTMDSLTPEGNSEHVPVPGFVAPLASLPQDSANVVSTKKGTNTNISSKKEPIAGVVHQSAMPSGNKKTPEKNERPQPLPQCTNRGKNKNKQSDNNVSEAKEDVVEERTKARENKYDPSIAIPLPWNIVPKLGKQEVFVFTGNDSTETVQIKQQPQDLTPAVRMYPSERTTVDRTTQCGLDIYPCTCDKTSGSKRVLCENCVDVRHPIGEKVVTAQNKSIHSPSRQTKKLEAKEPVKYSSSKTQTSHSSFEKSSKIKAENTVDNTKCETFAADDVRRDIENELLVYMDGRPESNKPDSKAPMNNTGACCNPTGTPTRSQEQTERMDSLTNKINRKPSEEQTSCKNRIREQLVRRMTPAQMKKIKELCSRLGRTKNGKASDFLDLANGLTDMTGNMEELFISLTADELDRVDGIHRDARSSENNGELLLKQESQVFPSGEDSRRNGSPVLGAVGGEMTSPQKKRRSSGRSPISPRIPHSTPDSSSKPKRSRSLEDLDLLAIEPSVDPRPFRFRPFEPENVNWEYENPFEISGCIRTDDHIDCGQKASRGHIPEIKVKQKRRGEPNKHLTTQHKDNELNPEDKVEESTVDNCSGDWSMMTDEPSGSTPGPSDSPLCDGDLGAAAATSNLPKEDEVVDEVLPDMRHCEKIPLEVIYGKKNDNVEQMDTPVKGKKKRKQKDKDRTTRGGPQILGLRLDF